MTVPRRIVADMVPVLVGLSLLISCDPGRKQDGVAGGSSSLSHPPLRTSAVSLSEAPLFSTDDLGHSLLARPMSVSQSSEGLFAFADISDNDVKLYSGDGKRVGTLGQSGEGPGEFMSLTSAVFLRDSLFAFDFLSQRMVIYDDVHNLVHSISVPGGLDGFPSLVRSVDDTLLLAVGMAMSVRQGNMVTLLLPDRSCCASSMLENRLRDPALIQSVAVMADARDGIVYGLVDDSLFAFDYGGRQVASGKLPGELMPRSWASLLAENNGQHRTASGRSVFHGHRLPFAFQALDSGTVAIQASIYDQETGIDIVGPASVGILAIDGRGGFTMLGALEASGGLLGRMADGSPLIVSYAEDSDAYQVSTLALSAAAGTDER